MAATTSLSISLFFTHKLSLCALLQILTQFICRCVWETDPQRQSPQLFHSYCDTACQRCLARLVSRLRTFFHQLCHHVPVVQGAVPLWEEMASSSPLLSIVDSGKVGIHSLYSQLLRDCFYGKTYNRLFSIAEVVDLECCPCHTQSFHAHCSLSSLGQPFCNAAYLINRSWHIGSYHCFVSLQADRQHMLLLDWQLICICALQILTFKESLKVWKSISFLGHFLMVGLILISVVMPPRSSKRSKPPVRDEQHKQLPQSKSSEKANWANSSVAGPEARWAA